MLHLIDLRLAIAIALGTRFGLGSVKLSTSNRQRPANSRATALTVKERIPFSVRQKSVSSVANRSTPTKEAPEKTLAWNAFPGRLHTTHAVAAALSLTGGKSSFDMGRRTSSQESREK